MLNREYIWGLDRSFDRLRAKMSKSVEINYKGENGYEILYPKTLQENIGGAILPEVTVNTWDGAVVVASHEDKSSSDVADGGSAVLSLPSYGNWNLSSTYGTFTGAGSLNVDTVKQYSIAIEVNMPTIVVSGKEGIEVKATRGTKEIKKIIEDGSAVLPIPEYGEWTVTENFFGVELVKTVNVTEITSYPVLFTENLEDFTWSQINTIIINGGINNFKVSSGKPLIINGTAGNLTFNNVTAYATIIGVNHNASREGNNKLHFQVSLASGNRNLIGYTKMWSGPIEFYSWNSCYMRTTVCAQFLNCLPVDLQSVIKSTSKYTNSGSNRYNPEIEMTSDKIFLPSEFEIFGSIRESASIEANYQKQYSWYTNHDAIKQNSGASYTWWERSPDLSNEENCCQVKEDGVSYGVDAGRASGFAPCFCI